VNIIKQKNKLGLIIDAPDLTLKEEKYHGLLAKYDVEHRVDSLPLTELVEFAENKLFSGDLVEKYLETSFLIFVLSSLGLLK
jgi:glutamate racemase